MVVSPISCATIYYEGVKLDYKVAPVEKIPVLNNNNNNNRSLHEQKKRNVQTTAAVLRISK
jgi:hypothetical protein